jgi:hypothetical protein
VLNALIETANVALLSGALTRSEMPTDSGRPHGVHRCSQCGTALCSEYGRVATLRFVRARRSACSYSVWISDLPAQLRRELCTLLRREHR